MNAAAAAVHELLPDESIPWTGLAAVATVIICAYDCRRWSCLVEALESVRAQIPRPERVLLVVDHNDKLLKMARDHWAEDQGEVPVSVVANRRSPGLSGARNTGIEETASPVIAFLDDDAIAQSGWLERLLLTLKRPGVLVCGGWATPADPSIIPCWWPPEYDWVVGCSHVGLPIGGGPVRNVIGCAMAFRREVFDLAGVFDEGVGRLGTNPLGCEETELCIRLTALVGGQPIHLVPDAVVRHQVEPERYTWCYFRRRCFAEGRSKARVRARTSSEATSVEASYLRRTVLPAIVDAGSDVFRRRPGALRRMSVLGAGVGIASAGYGSEQILNLGRRARAAPLITRRSSSRQHASSPFNPTRASAE